MNLAAQLRSHRKDSRVIIGVLAVLLCLLTAIFYFILRSRELPATLVANRVLLFILWYIDVVLILAILFVLFRNIIKLLIERRHRILGSKFKTKLVATYIGLSLLPVLILFVYASRLLQQSIDRWFAAPVAEVLAHGNAVAQAMNRNIEATGLRDAALVGGEIGGLDLNDAEQRPRVARRLREQLASLRLDLVAVYYDTEFVHAALNPEAGLADLPEPGRNFLLEALREGQAVRVQAPPAGLAGRLVLTAWSPPGAGGPRPVVVTGTLLEPTVAAQSEQLIAAFQSFRQFEVQRGDVKASHLLTFLMVTLLILLASAWTGLYLARRVTVPIQALAEGTERISRGDLDHRVEVAADDELGILVNSFNRMTGDLRRGSQELLAANERLAEERAAFAAVLQNVAAGVISLDGSGRISTCNGAALQMLRQSESDVVGKLPAEAWPDGERAKLAALIADTASAPRASLELRMALGGEWQTFETKTTTMRDPSGQANGKVVVLEDLTELIKAQKLAAWSEAAKRIAHEIKNPLTPIQLAAERLLKKHRAGDPNLGPALEEGVAIIVREVATMKTMVDEFSRFARMPHPQPSNVDLPGLIDETLRLYRGLKPGVEVASQVESTALRAWLDAEQIKRVLINLLDNAIEATEAPGEVRVSARSDNDRLEIQVRDNGRGIPDKAKEKLFLPYFSTKGRGTGLGLAIVHRIVSDHHGAIRVEDNPPRGTRFIVELPLA